MSGRIAYRPRSRQTRPTVQFPPTSRRTFLPSRWTYRRHDLVYEKRFPGYSLSLIPLSYRFMGMLLLPTSK